MLTGGDNPTGTITFTLTGPGGNVLDTETTTVNGNGIYTTPTGFVPTAVGAYRGPPPTAATATTTRSRLQACRRPPSRAATDCFPKSG